MSITISPTAEDLRATADRLALRVADLVAERDVAIGEARDGVATARRFKDGRDHAVADADEARQAGLDLQHALNRASAQAEAYLRINLKLQDLIDGGNRERRLLRAAAEDMAATVTDVVRENGRLRTELDAEIHANRHGRHRRFRRRR